MATSWLTVSGRQVPQIRLDEPILNEDGRKIRYLFPKGEGGIIGSDAGFERYWNEIAIPLLLVEGTKQFQAAASTINFDHPVAVPFGIAGCWGWSKDFKPSQDLLALPAEGRDVLVAFDADIITNWMVWEAARRLDRYLTQELGARTVRFLLNPGIGGEKDGLDDFLGRQPTPERRINRLRHLIDTALEHKKIKAPRKPSKRSGFFDGNNFKPISCWSYLNTEHHLAMSGDESVAVYHQGVYWNSTSWRWTRVVTETLGNDYKPEHEHNLTKVALSHLKTDKKIIPLQQKRPVINFLDGLLDVQTMELKAHTPDHLTLIQLPYKWSPAAECSVFKKWIEQVAPGQLSILMDICSQMLDLSEWPRMIAFFTGPTRSGKSTMIRILNALVGQHLRSHVSLHDLSRAGDDRFASASLFGKVLNTFADLSANDLQDLSLVKVLTGGDEFEAQRKGCPRFTMRNQAMLVFSANSIPSTSENSGAFLARVAHFEFPNSFAGREDKTIEDSILANELPGILRLMVEALHQRKKRGNFLPLDANRQQKFAEQTDKVRMFLRECTIAGDRSRICIPRSELYEIYKLWAEENSGRRGLHLGKQKFNERVRLAGVDEFTPKGGTMCWNLLNFDLEKEDQGGFKATDQGLLKPQTEGGGWQENEQALTPLEANNPQSAFCEVGVASKTPTTKTASAAVGKDIFDRAQSDVSAVFPYSPSPMNSGSELFASQEWVETTETTDILTAPSDELTSPCSKGPLVIDLETQSATKLWDVSNPHRPFIRLVGTDHGNNVDPSQLLNHSGALVAHNGWNFDFMALAHHHALPLLDLSEKGRLIDTMVLGLTLDPPDKPDMGGGQIAKYYSLNNCAKRFGFKGKAGDLASLASTAAKAAGYNVKSKELENIGYGLIPQSDPNYNAYLRGDVEATRAVFDHLVPTGELNAYCKREMKIMGRLTAGITLTGTRLDVDLTRKRFKEVEQKKEHLRQILVEEFGLPTTTADGKPAKNPLSCTGASEAIKAAAAAVGLTLPLTSKTGKPSTSKDSLDPLLKKARETDDERQVFFLETIIGLTGARCVYGTALNYLQADGRIHPQISPLQASGRFSITKPGVTVFGKHDGKAVEREIFLPDCEDHLLLAADLSQIDMRAIAAHAQDPDYLELFAPGRDAHDEIANAVGLSRSDAKAIGHGWNYGMSINGMVCHGIDQDLAEQFDGRMSHSFPQLVRWRESVRLKAGRGERLDNGFGRLMKANPDRAYTQAPALMGQGTARDLMMEVVLRLPLHLIRQLRFLVHDELVFSLPQERLEDSMEEILQAMSFEWAPPKASLKVRVIGELSRPGRNWAECYS